MARRALIERELKRQKLIEKYAKKRALLKKRVKEGDWSAMYELQKLPRDSSPTRQHNRCKINGRPRGYLRKFGISRVKFRELANMGDIPGVTKSSW